VFLNFVQYTLGKEKCLIPAAFKHFYLFADSFLEAKTPRSKAEPVVIRGKQKIFFAIPLK
jgi:hypothetical protein